MSKKVADVITDRMIEKLEKGVVPWRKSWQTNTSANVPMNIITRKPYRSINFFLLLLTGHSSPFWATYKQIKQLGGNVNKGEKGYPVTFYSVYEKDTGETNDAGEAVIEQRWVMRYYTVFNLDQTVNVKVPKPAQKILDSLKAEKPDENHVIDSAQDIVNDYLLREKIDLRTGEPAYNPLLDTIYMPDDTAFDSPEEYYSTIYHEQVHSTGHANRLNRDLKSRADKESYSKEELIAELGASILCAETGINTDEVFDNSTAYINGWLSRLKEDPNFIIQSAARAQKAVDFILNRNVEQG